MDTEALHVVLQQSFSPDDSIRRPAEATIKTLKHVKGATVMLLQVAAEHQVQFEVRQAAAIQLKNICRECWAERVAIMGYTVPIEEKSPLLPDDDKEHLRNNLMEALFAEHEKSVRDLLAETFYNIVVHDYPDKWPSLVPGILNTISQGSNDPAQALRVHNALLALRKLCKRYEYKAKEKRGPLNEIVAQSFPLLLPLAQRLIDPNQHSLEAAMMLKQILKIFWSATQFYLPGGDATNPSPALTNPESMQPWFDIMQQVLAKPLPEASTGLEPRGQPTEIEERNAWPWWKVKKWSVQIMSRLFSRYGVPAYAEEEVQLFAQHFSQNIATSYLGTVCETLNLRPSGQFCTDRVMHLCLTYVDLAVELAPTYKLLKPHLDFLLYKVCFPTICLTDQDVSTFENDPHEFVQRQHSPLADFYDPRQSAVTLIVDLVKHRGQDVTQPLLGRMTEILHRYGAADPNARNHREKDGALMVFGSLNKYLLSKKKYHSQIELMLVQSVFPDFNSPIGFLRCRACWMAQQFSDVSFSDDGTYLRTLLSMILQRMSDPALPVQIEASKALQFLIKHEGAETTLLPVLPQILTEYFRIMNEIGNDEVVAALQVIIDKFGDHIEPHAVALVSQLSQAFVQYCTAGEDDDDDAALAAAQCLECIATVLKGICEKPELFKALEPQLIPLVLRILGDDGDLIEYLEYALDILTFLVYFPNEITPELWQAFPLIYLAFDGWAYDYLNLMISPLQSFIYKAPHVFLLGKAQIADATVPYIDLLFSMVSKTVGNDRASESECRQALSLFMTVLHNCPGQIDGYLTVINEIILAKLSQQLSAQSASTRIAIYQVLGSALYYNPALELQELERRQVTQQVFSQWMKDASEGALNDKWYARKMTVLGLTAILTLPVSSMPPSIANSLSSVIIAAVTIAEKMKSDAEKEADRGEEDGTDLDEEYEDDDEEGFDESQDVKDDIDEIYKSALSGVSGFGDDDIARFLLGDFDEEDDIDDDYISPLDQVNELLVLNDTLKAAFAREPEFYQQIQASLPPETVLSCQKLFAAADEARAQAQPQN